MVEVSCEITTLSNVKDDGQGIYRFLVDAPATTRGTPNTGAATRVAITELSSGTGKGAETLGAFELSVSTTTGGIVYAGSDGHTHATGAVFAAKGHSMLTSEGLAIIEREGRRAVSDATHGRPATGFDLLYGGAGLST
jgi:hypothetical protein